MRKIIVNIILAQVDRAMWKTVKENQEYIKTQDEQITAQITTINDLLEEVNMKDRIITKMHEEIAFYESNKGTN